MAKMVVMTMIPKAVATAETKLLGVEITMMMDIRWTWEQIIILLMNW